MEAEAEAEVGWLTSDLQTNPEITPVFLAIITQLDLKDWKSFGRIAMVCRKWYTHRFQAVMGWIMTWQDRFWNLYEKDACSLFEWQPEKFFAAPGSALALFVRVNASRPLSSLLANWRPQIYLGIDRYFYLDICSKAQSNNDPKILQVLRKYPFFAEILSNPEELRTELGEFEDSFLE